MADQPHHLPLSSPRSRAFIRLASLAAALALWAAPATLPAQSSKWDALISNSNWFVLEENLLSYVTSGSSFIDPPPMQAWDQTLWDLGDSVNGQFSGTSQAELKYNPLINTKSISTVVGVVTDSGQVRMQFTDDASGLVTDGIGQIRNVEGVDYVQMQMITGYPGDEGSLVTHWAYMAQYDPATFTPAPPAPNDALTSQEWLWVADTTWQLSSDELFGDGGSGQFQITNYRNGYFWGSGSGPAGSSAEAFSLLGSITPEGNLLYNVLSNGELTSLTGHVTGDPRTGRMTMRRYTLAGEQGTPAVASIVPEPASATLLATAACLVAACRRKRCSE
jgi:hypothetical protein